MRTLTPRLTRRKKRVSANIIGSEAKPRVAIHRSNRYIFAQVIDDGRGATGTTIAAIDSRSFESAAKATKTEAAKAAGESLGKKLLALKVMTVVIDRSRFRYIGRVASFVEGLRGAGVQV